MFKIILISTLVLAATAALDIVCPEEGQSFYPHQTRCKKFIECHNGVQTEIDCMDGFVFNPEIGWCDFAENVNCVDVQEPTPSEPDLGGPVGECPPVNGEYVDFLTDSADCTKFYMCNWGNPIQMVCPVGLHFNPTLNVCDWPLHAGCTAGQ